VLAIFARGLKIARCHPKDRRAEKKQVPAFPAVLDHPRDPGAGGHGGGLHRIRVWASTFDLKEVDNIPERSAVFDMDGKFYARLAGENRVVVHLQDVSQFFVKALMAREDSRFYSHHGIDP